MKVWIYFVLTKCECSYFQNEHRLECNHLYLEWVYINRSGIYLSTKKSAMMWILEWEYRSVDIVLEWMNLIYDWLYISFNKPDLVCTKFTLLWKSEWACEQVYTNVCLL